MLLEVLILTVVNMSINSAVNVWLGPADVEVWYPSIAKWTFKTYFEPVIFISFIL